MAQEFPESDKIKLNQEHAEVFRNIQDGVLCRGVYFTQDLDQVLKERERVIDVKDDIEFKETTSIHKICNHQFKSEKLSDIFESNVDKHIPSRSATVGENIYGISIEGTKSENKVQVQGFLSSVHYQLIPVRTIHLLPKDIKLRPDVVDVLQQIEETIQSSNYESSNQFGDFFQKYGSHVNHGVIRIGGILTSIASCEGIQEEDHSRLSAAVTDASEAALLFGFSKQLSTGISFNAHEVLGTTLGISAEDLQKITVTFDTVGGPTDTSDKDKWKEELTRNNQLWRVISRSSQPKPIWTLLSQYKDDFKDYSRLSEAMQNEWKIIQLSVRQEKETMNLRPRHHPILCKNGMLLRKKR